MRIALYTMHGPAIAEMSAITVPNKIEYCQRHGYSYFQEPFTGAMWPGFERLPPLIGLLKSKLFDWVFWLGTDCLITNLHVRLESILDPKFGIVIAVDAFDIQMDSLLVRAADERAISLLEKVFSMRDKPAGIHEEQSSMSAIMRQPEFGGCVKLVPQRTMNSYEYRLYTELGLKYISGTDLLGTHGEWSRGDFVYHVPGRPLGMKLERLRAHVPLIVR